MSKEPQVQNDVDARQPEQPIVAPLGTGVAPEPAGEVDASPSAGPGPSTALSDDETPRATLRWRDRYATPATGEKGV